MTTPVFPHINCPFVGVGAQPAPSRHSFQKRLRRWVPAVLAYASAVSASVVAAAALVAADLPGQVLIAVI